MNFRMRKPFQQPVHNMLDIPLAHRRVIRDNNTAVTQFQIIGFFQLLNQVHMVRGNPYSTFGLRVSPFTNINNSIALCRFLTNQIMSLRYIRTCCVDYG